MQVTFRAATGGAGDKGSRYSSGIVQHFALHTAFDDEGIRVEDVFLRHIGAVSSRFPLVVYSLSRVLPTSLCVPRGHHVTRHHPSPSRFPEECTNICSHLRVCFGVVSFGKSTLHVELLAKITVPSCVQCSTLPLATIYDG